MKGKKEELIFLKDREETRSYIISLADRLEAGDLVLLEGDLGAGKTQFVQWMASHYGVEGPVVSPTFSLVNHYQGKKDGQELDLFHLDLYRLEDPMELEDLDYERYFYPRQAISFVEWPDRAQTYLPPHFVRVQIDKGEGEERKVKVQCV